MECMSASKYNANTNLIALLGSAEELTNHRTVTVGDYHFDLYRAYKCSDGRTYDVLHIAYRNNPPDTYVYDTGRDGEHAARTYMAMFVAAAIGESISAGTPPTMRLM